MRFRRQRDSEQQQPAEVYLGLRQQVLSLTATELGDDELELDIVGPDGIRPPAGMFTVTPATVTLPEGGTVSATVTAFDGFNDFTDHAVVDTVSVHQGPGAALDWRDGSGNHIVAVVGSTDDEEQLQGAYQLLHREVTVTYTDVRH